MKRILLGLFLVAGIMTARSGEIFGTLTDASKPVPQGTKVEVTAGGNTYSGETDKFGGYRIFVKEKGKCTLKVNYNNQAPTFEVMSFEKGTRYDLVLENKDGKYSLKRK